MLWLGLRRLLLIKVHILQKIVRCVLLDIIELFERRFNLLVIEA